MKQLYTEIVQAKATGKQLLAILLDPEKIKVEDIAPWIHQINRSPATHILIGGSSFEGTHLDDLIWELKKEISLPILLFPGHYNQISTKADGILFLQLLSGRNPDYLIEHQIQAVPQLESTALEILSTGYILIESGHETAVARVSKTQPLPRNDFDYVAQTAKAGEYMGNALVYLEAGSGASQAVPLEMITTVAQRVTIPILVGGGIRSSKAIAAAYEAGATMVVIGTAFEQNLHFFD
jgi:phosphoglycerol geranylgeranyltransferase